MKRLVFLFLFVAIAAGPGAPRAEAYEAENVFIVIIDGVRNTEAFEDPAHQYIPHMWNDLRPKGVIYRNFRNIDHTVTTAGHVTITSGVGNYLPLNFRNGFLDVKQEEPSIFEEYRKQYSIPAEKTWIVNGKGASIANIGMSLNPLLGSQYAPKITPGLWVNSDIEIWTKLQYIMDIYHPSLVLVNLQDVDDEGHYGDWASYTAAIVEADSIVFELFNKLQNDPFYRNNTTLIVTTDHGRHCDGILQEYHSHGDACSCCRKLPFLALGPDIKRNTVVEAPASLEDITTTVAELLGVSMSYSEGNLLRDLFVTPPPYSEARARKPAITADGSFVHMVWTENMNGIWNIYYQGSSDGGSTWQAKRLLNSSTGKSMSPAVAARDGKLVVLWSQYQNSVWRIMGRQSLDNGATWSKAKYLTAASELGANLTPAASVDGAFIDVVWSDVFNLEFQRLTNGKLVATSSSPTQHHVYSPAIASSNGVTHCVYTGYDYDNFNWEIYYSRVSENAWSQKINLSGFSANSMHSSVALAPDAIHVVWADDRDGAFEIYYRRSVDSINWSAPIKLTNSGTGAWHPMIFSVSGALILVWEDYSDGSAQIFLARSNDGGINWDPAQKLTGNNPSINPVAAASGESIVVAYQELVDGEWKIKVLTVPAA